MFMGSAGALTGLTQGEPDLESRAGHQGYFSMHICFADFDTASVALLDDTRQPLGYQELSECGMS